MNNQAEPNAEIIDEISALQQRIRELEQRDSDHKLLEETQLFLLQHCYPDEDFFASLARYLAQSLEMDYVCIDRLLGDRLTAQTVAVYFDGKFEDNVEYSLKDTPCGDVVGKTICCFPQDVRHLFPKDVILQEMVAESYVGTTLWSSKGQPIGLIAVLSRKPLVNPRLAETILKLVAIRAAGELERRKVEEERSQSKRRFRLLHETMLQGVVYQDAEGKIISMNPAAIRILGRSPEESLGHSSESRDYPTLRGDGSFLPVDDHPSMVALRTGQELRDVVMGVYNPCEKGYRWISVRAVPLLSPGEDKPYQAYIIFDDITERKKAERRQSLSVEVLGIINDSLPLADTINGILTALKRETGCEAVGIRLRRGDDFPYFIQNGFSDDFLLTENTLKVRAQNGGICRDTQGNIRLECTCGLVISGQADPTNPLFTQEGSFWTNDSLPLLDLTADQDPRLNPRNRCIHEGFSSVALIPIRANREIVGLLQLNGRKKGCFTLDMITFFEGLGSSIGIAFTRKWAEEAIKERTSQLEAANKELESFSYSISHDLRSPLRAIAGYTHMLVKTHEDTFDADAKHKFQVIRNNVQKMGQLIDDLLAFARVGRQALSLSVLDMEKLVEEVWQEQIATNPDRRIELKNGTLPQAFGDRTIVRQVLFNLLANAVKFTKNKDTALIEVGGKSAGTENIYYVKDNGAGFDMTYYGKLFGVFQRLHSDREYEGTGVGLAIVKQGINRQGGRVWGEGMENEGATFYFTLPLTGSEK